MNSIAAGFVTGAGGYIGGFGKNDTNADLTSFDMPFFNFYYKFNADGATTFTLEANVQEDENGDGMYNTNDDDEFRATIPITDSPEFTLFSQPISSFALNQNGQAGGDGIFNGTVAGVVFTVTNATPDDGTDPSEGGNIVLDYVSFSNATLPVEMTAFDAVGDGRDAVLQWTVASETNNAGFEIQEASDGEVFHTVGFEPGAGTTRETHHYQFRVPDLAAGAHTFRLRQMDLDGGEKLSETQSVTIRAAEPFELVSGFTNPMSSGTATMRFTVQQPQPVQITLYNVIGQRVRILYDGSVQPEDVQKVDLNTRGLRSGTYFVRCTGRSFTRTEHLVVVK